MANLLEICSVDEPNLSREDLQGLQLVGRRGGKMMFRVGTDNKLIMINSSTVERLEMSIRSRKSPPRQVKLLLQRDAEDIWSGLNQNHNRDHLATICMLQILKEYYTNDRDLFSNGERTGKFALKKDLWMEVADKLIAEGFQFRDRPIACERVNQKWRNLERSYRLYTESVGTGGNNITGRSTEPEFYKELHQLLGAKYSRSAEEVETTTYEVSMDDEQHQQQQQSADNTLHHYLTAGGYEEVQVGQEFFYPSDDEETASTGEEHLPPPSPTVSMEIVDHKNFLWPPEHQVTNDSVFQLLLEMRSQEMAHHREQRREQLNLQKETLEFQRQFLQLVTQQHKETMEATYALIAAIGQKN